MISRRNYPLLLVGQFLGAFGDNFLLAAILAPLTFALRDGHLDANYVSAQNAVFSAVFFVPFILLAPLAGWVNDRMPKTTWLSGGNLVKFAGAAIGCFGVWLHAGDFDGGRGWQLVGYTIVGIGACLYSPAKYGILPEVVPQERLLKANGMIEMLTLVSVVGGLAIGAIVYDRTRSMLVCYAASLFLYAAALVFNAFMERTPCDPKAIFSRSLVEFFATLRALFSIPRTARILVGCGAFWFVGAALRNNIQGWGLMVFQQAGRTNTSNEQLAILKVGLVTGIVAGSVLAGRLHRLGDLSWSRFYGMMMAVFILILGLMGGIAGVLAALVVLVLAGLFSGLLIVPLNASLQNETDQRKLGKTVAIQNFTDYLAMLVGAGFLGVLAHFGVDPMQTFVWLAAVMVLLSLALRLAARKS